MTLARKTGTYAIAAAASFAALIALSPDASAQYRRPGMSGPRPPAVGGMRGGGFRGAYRGGWRGHHGGWRGHRGWGGGAAAAGVIGGLALGALAAGAMEPAPPPPGYGVYGGPGYGPYDGYCEIRRERYWDGYRWRVQRVRVCP